MTGAGSGIGRAIAGRLSAEGATVVVSDIDAGAGNAAVREITEGGGTALFVGHDVSSREDWSTILGIVADKFGGLDILVNNAGVGDVGSIDDQAQESWDRTISIDLTGVYLGMRMSGGLLAASAHATVVNISSICGSSGTFGGVAPAYHAAKGGVRSLTKSVALGWAERGIRVNSVHPGFIGTQMVARAEGTPAGEAMLGLTPMGRLGTPDDVAAGVAYLVSDDAAFVTGTELYIDGGYMAR